MEGQDLHSRSFLVPPYGEEEQRDELEAIVQHRIHCDKAKDQPNGPSPPIGGNTYPGSAQSASAPAPNSVSRPAESLGRTAS